MADLDSRRETRTSNGLRIVPASTDGRGSAGSAAPPLRPSAESSHRWGTNPRRSNTEQEGALYWALNALSWAWLAASVVASFGIATVFAGALYAYAKRWALAAFISW